MDRLFSFHAGNSGKWQIVSSHSVIGEPLPITPRLEITSGDTPAPIDTAWCLRGITSNERYVHRSERTELLARQEGLGRAQATCAALIPIRKSAAWWQLTQEERREVFEAQSRHTEIGLKALPQVARRLHHCRDLGEREPFDFLTWFEFAPEHENAFDELLHALRETAEWGYVEREAELRLVSEKQTMSR